VTSVIRINEILDKITSYNPKADIEEVRRSYIYSAKVHDGQVRRSGAPYLIHPMEVAGILADLKLDTPSIATGLLHDTIEDTEATQDEIESLFGQEIGRLVDGVTKINKMSFTSRQEQEAENFRKMLVAMAKDIRVILVKLADRLHNMRTLEHMPSASQLRTSRETIDIYAPLANRLGLGWVKDEMEDLSLLYLKAETYYDLGRRLNRKKKIRNRYIDEVKRIITDKLNEYGIECEVFGRPKHFYSIYRKMEVQQIDFDQVYDLIAFRIVVKTVRDCYAALGVIHSLWTPVPGRFKDFIGIPKANMYQSLHTTVIGPYGERVEIQIRTYEMHRVAETGIAAHWMYKEKGSDLTEKEGQRFTWLRQLMEWQQDMKDPSEFLESVKVDLFPDEVYVFTPKGEVKAFPRGATPIDFAYRIHTDIGHRCVGAKVNGKLVQIKSKLTNGDTVEIITSKNATPNKDWLEFTKTLTAQSKIRSWIRKEETKKSQDLGREICTKEFKRYGLNFIKLVRSGELKSILKEHFKMGMEEGMADIAYGKLSVHRLIEKILPPEKIKDGLEEETTIEKFERFVSRFTRRPDAAIRVSGLEDVMVRFGKCCSPIPGDGIVGYITRGRGLTVHNALCARVREMEPERKIEVTWDSKVKTANPARLRIVCDDQPGLLAAVSKVISSADINITDAHMWTTKENRATGDFQISVKDLAQLQSVIKSIERVKGVISVARQFTSGRDQKGDSGKKRVKK